jgi:hypothetical protein
VRREENTQADRLSKALDRDWTLGEEAYQAIVSRWGQVEPLNRETLAYSAGQPKRLILATPKFGQIMTTIQIAEQFTLPIVIVHPVWQAQVWWPRLASESDYIRLPHADECIIPIGDRVGPFMGWEMRATRLATELK